MKRRAMLIVFAAAWLAVFGCAGHDEWRTQVDQQLEEQGQELNAIEEQLDRGGPFPDSLWQDQDDEDAKDEYTNWQDS